MEPIRLDEIEERVHEAVRRLRQLRQENEELTARLRELEDQLGGPEQVDWRQEREEVRQRVERLVHGLEALVE